jgi:peroxin-1
MPSARKLASVVGRDGINSTRAGKDSEMSLVEISPVFARLVGLHDGQKIAVSLHTDPPQAHTVNIEPLTPADWESRFTLNLKTCHSQLIGLTYSD